VGTWRGLNLKLLILVFCVCCCGCCSDSWRFAVINVATEGIANRAVVNAESTVEIIRLNEAGNGGQDVVCLR